MRLLFILLIQSNLLSRLALLPLRKQLHRGLDDSSNVLCIRKSSECISISLFLACGTAESLQRIEVEGIKIYWFVENVTVPDVVETADDAYVEKSGNQHKRHSQRLR